MAEGMNGKPLSQLDFEIGMRKFCGNMFGGR